MVVLNFAEDVGAGSMLCVSMSKQDAHAVALKYVLCGGGVPASSWAPNTLTAKTLLGEQIT